MVMFMDNHPKNEAIQQEACLAINNLCINNGECTVGFQTLILGKTSLRARPLWFPTGRIANCILPLPLIIYTPIWPTLPYIMHNN